MTRRNSLAQRQIDLTPGTRPATAVPQTGRSGWLARATCWGALAVAAGLMLGLVAAPAVADKPADQPSRQPAEDPKEPAAEPENRDPIGALVERLRAAGQPKDQKQPEGEEEAQTAAATSENDSATEAPVSTDGRPDAKRMPTPAELIRQMREQQAAEQAKPLIAQIDFSLPVTEQPAGFALFGPSTTDLRSILDRLHKAENDPDCRAVLLTFFNGGMMNLAQAQEIRGSLESLRRAGKRTFVYADSYDTISYLVASAATDVCLLEGGEIFIPGVAAEPMFFRGTLDILGIQPDFIQIGEYKGAQEPYMRSEPSEELAEEMNRLVNAIYDQIIRQISSGRDVPASTVRQLVDDALIPAPVARQHRLVDHLVDADGIRQIMAEEFGEEVRLDASYGEKEGERFDPDNPFAIFQLMRPREVRTAGPSIAIIYAEGVITGGDGGPGGLFDSGGVGSEAIRRAMRRAARDENVKAVVIRIDSPGGSALASEVMYQSIRRVAEEKPVIISIGGMAASGGYYLAVAGDHIIADPAAVVGSIGVVGGKMVMGGLYDKLGLSTASFTAGRNANLFSATQPWDERQQRLVRNWMRSTYDTFTERVMSTREGKIQDIDAVARGRIFLAQDALGLGMVDELGGLQLAIARAAERAELEEFETVVITGGQANPLGGFPFGQAEMAPHPLQMMPAEIREALGQTLMLHNLLSERPVVLISPYTITVR